MKIIKYILIISLLLASVAMSAENLKVRIDSPVAPVVVGIEASPVSKVTLYRAGDRDCSVEKVCMSFSGTTDCFDIEQVCLYGVNKKGLPDTGRRLSDPVGLVGENAEISCDIDIVSDTTVFWVAVKLKDTVCLDHKVYAKCEKIETSSGRLRVPENGHSPMRAGVAVRKKNQDGVASSRIPGLAAGVDGTLYAVFDARHDSARDLQGNIDIGMHRSSDGGMTWKPLQIVLDMGTWGGLPEKYNGVSDACILVDKVSGDILVAGLWMHGLLDKNGNWIDGLNENSTEWEHQWKSKGSQPGHSLKQTCQFLITRSSDGGETWSFPDNITLDTKPEQWWLYAPAPGHGITMSDGTLVFPTQGRDAEGRPFSNITYSADHGRTWTASSCAYSDVTECNVVELDSSSLMLNMRDNRNKGNKSVNGRRICVTTDLGKTWQEHHTSRNALVEPTCMGALHRHEYIQDGKKKTMLLFSNPSDTSVRENLTLKASLDMGETWPDRYHIKFDQFRSAGYSSIESVDNDTIGILYESALADLVFIRISLDEILSYKESKPNNQ